jgi:hypothetical protein
MKTARSEAGETRTGTIGAVSEMPAGSLTWTSRSVTRTYALQKFERKLYPKYDNYDAIEVSTYKDIPVDFDGVMACP